MANSLTRPTIVIVPGSFCPTSFYSTVTGDLSAQGYEAICVDLPSVGRNDGVPGPTMADDAAHVQAVTSKLADKGKDIVIVTHSYGGIVGTESAKGLGKADRKAMGRKGGISRLVYVTSLVPPVGGTLRTLMGDTVMDSIVIEGDYMSHKLGPTAASIISDLPEAEALSWVEKMPGHSAPSFGGALSYAAYKYIPVSYLVCEGDKVIAPALQKEIIARIEEESGAKVDVHTLNSGHCPNISVPKDLVAVIRRVCGERI